MLPTNKQSFYFCKNIELREKNLCDLCGSAWKKKIDGIAEGGASKDLNPFNGLTLTKTNFRKYDISRPDPVPDHGTDYEISSNRELGYGRYDILITLRHDRTRPAILMEMKSITGFYEEEPEKAIQDAMEQINTRAYAKELEARGFDNVIRIVVVSDGKKVWVRTL